MTKQDPSRFLEPSRVKPAEVEYRIGLEDYFARSVGGNVEKLQNFAKYVPAQDLRRFICRYEVYRLILEVHGSIIDCGVNFGGSLMTWALLGEILEPLNHLRKVVGFDTFSGFVGLSDKDQGAKAEQAKPGGLAIDTYDDLLESIRLFDQNRFLSHIPKVSLVRGDVSETLPRYLQDNPHTVVSLLVLDFDIYEPTLAALRHLVPRMPKGGVIVFDELNHEVWPGETLAVMEAIGLSNLRLRRFPFGPTMSYAVIE